MTNYDKRPRPSKLPHIEACPRFESAPDDRKADSLTEAADEGTLIHAKMEQLAGVDVTLWDNEIKGMKDIDQLQADLVRASAEQVRDLFQVGLPQYTKTIIAANPKWSWMVDNDHYLLQEGLGEGIFAEVSVDPVLCQPGTADLVVVHGNRAVLVDYKTVRMVRDHDLQMVAYAIGILLAYPKIKFVEVRIVTPRLGEVHEVKTYSRDEIMGPMLTEARRIVFAHLDPFTPGSPCDSCAMCAGNGRCPWQMASLRDVPIDGEDIMAPGVWAPVLAASTPALRGTRRRLVKWLEAFVDAAKDDDKQWALENPDVMLPGFSKIVGLGRATLDKDRLIEINETLSQRFGIQPKDLLGYCVPDKARLGEFVAVISGLSQKEAEAEIAKALGPFTTRGSEIISFRAVKEKKAIK